MAGQVRRRIDGFPAGPRGTRGSRQSGSFRRTRFCHERTIGPGSVQFCLTREASNRLMGQNKKRNLRLQKVQIRRNVVLIKNNVKEDFVRYKR